MWLNKITPVLFVVVMSSSMTQSASECPRSCRCDQHYRVYCQQKNLSVVPYGIPRTTRFLNLRDNDVINSPTTEENLSQLTRLRDLKMYQNSLTSVPSGLPSSLEYISLRNNRIRYIGKNSLKGLRSLVELVLDGNNITNQGLSTLAFSDTDNLEVLMLSNNLLTSVPEGLPRSLRVLRLENNRIQTISVSSLKSLESLSILDLSNNNIHQQKIGNAAFASLRSLRSLSMNANVLTRVPSDLPTTLRDLYLSANQIEYVSIEDTSLKRLNRLESFDLSWNVLKSIQDGVFSNLTALSSISLHGNPWNCDCHLGYFKRWLSVTTSAISNRQDITCQSPSYLFEVTIDDVDLEALECDTRSKTSSMLSIKDTSSRSMVASWGQPRIDPPFVKKFMFYGAITCQNCSLDSATQLSGVTSIVDKYSLVDFTSQLRQNPLNVTLKMEKLNPGTRYIVCVYDSEQDVTELSINQCVDVWTNQLPPSDPPAIVDKQESFPSILIVIISCVTLLVVCIVVMSSVIILRRRRISKKSKPTRSSYHVTGRDDFFYPESYLPGYTYTPAPPNGFGTTASDRTYMECGEADAMQEFNVTLLPTKPCDVTSPKHVVASQSEYSSSNSGYPTPTMSTNQTAASGSRDGLDSIIEHQASHQRSENYETPMTSRLRHETGIFV